jgi:hypothetical protein
MITEHGAHRILAPPLRSTVASQEIDKQQSAAWANRFCNVAPAAVGSLAPAFAFRGREAEVEFGLDAGLQGLLVRGTSGLLIELVASGCSPLRHSAAHGCEWRIAPEAEASPGRCLAFLRACEGELLAILLLTTRDQPAAWLDRWLDLSTVELFPLVDPGGGSDVTSEEAHSFLPSSSRRVQGTGRA